MIIIPNIAQHQWGIFDFWKRCPFDNFKKHSGGSTKARTVAENPPVSSSTTPRLHVSKDMITVVNIRIVVIKKWRVILNGADGQ